GGPAAPWARKGRARSGAATSGTLATRTATSGRPPPPPSGRARSDGGAAAPGAITEALDTGRETRRGQHPAAMQELVGHRIPSGQRDPLPRAPPPPPPPP